MSETGNPQSEPHPAAELVTAIEAVRPQHRVSVSGVILLARPMTIGGTPACRYTLTDGTGDIDLIFLGRISVPGLKLGRQCAAEGMAAERDGQVVLWNPRYWLQAESTADAGLSHPESESELSTAGHLLIVEDDPTLLRILEKNLVARGYEVALAPTGAAALDRAGERQPDVIVLDLGLPDVSGLELIDALQARCDAPIVVISAAEGTAGQAALIEAGAADYLPKPFAIQTLVESITAAAAGTLDGLAEAALTASG